MRIKKSVLLTVLNKSGVISDKILDFTYSFI
jgi:hypothetical protein